MTECMIESKERPAISQHLKDLMHRLFTRGTSAFIIILGRRETGKSDFAYLICEILLELGLFENFASNGTIYKSPFLIKKITSLEELRIWSESLKGRKLFVFDEFGKAFKRRRPMSSLNLKLIDDMQTLRKNKLSIIGIAPADTYIDSTAFGSDVLDAIFIKPHFKNPKVAIYRDALEYESKTITDIPATSIGFDEWDVAPFTERAAGKMPRFKDKDLEILWKWSNGTPAKDLGLFHTQINRLTRKFIKDILEREHNT